MPSNLVLVAACAMTTAAGCSKSSETTRPNPDRAPQAGEAGWKLKFDATCAEGTPAESCVGAYGFILNQDGSYVVGPGPQGQTWNGTLETAELEKIAEQVEKVTGSVGTLMEGEAPCNEIQLEVVRNETVSYARGGEFRDLSRYQPNRYCARGDSETTRELHQALLQLVRDHYPTPFPDTCFDEAKKVIDLQAKVSGCQVDSDCSWIDNAYEPISNGTFAFGYLDNCSWVRPLSAGNTALVAAYQDQLDGGRERQVHRTRRGRPHDLPRQARVRPHSSRRVGPPGPRPERGTGRARA